VTANVRGPGLNLGMVSCIFSFPVTSIFKLIFVIGLKTAAALLTSPVCLDAYGNPRLMIDETDDCYITIHISTHRYDRNIVPSNSGSGPNGFLGELDK
jgi:hypothetical protein